MKKLLTLLLLITLKCAAALTITPIGLFPNTSTLQTNWLFLVTVAPTPTTGTNYNMSVLQFESWIANDPNFTSFLKGNTNLSLTGSSTNFTTQTVSPNVIFTNTESQWTTNQSFTSSFTFSPGPVWSAHLVYSNSSSASNIICTLPATMYSLSLGTNVTQAIIQTNSMLDLIVDYYNGSYIIKDYGINNNNLYQIANVSGHGFLFLTNGVWQFK